MTTFCILYSLGQIPSMSTQTLMTNRVAMLKEDGLPNHLKWVSQVLRQCNVFFLYRHSWNSGQYSPVITVTQLKTNYTCLTLYQQKTDHFDYNTGLVHWLQLAYIVLAQK